MKPLTESNMRVPARSHITNWKLSACDIQELPLLATSSHGWQILANQPWAPGPQGKTGTHHTYKTVEKTEGGRERENREATWRQKLLCKRRLGLNSKSVVHAMSIWTPGACVQRDTAGHGATLSLFVVSSVKLHLTTWQNGGSGFLLKKGFTRMSTVKYFVTQWCYIIN